MITSSSLFTIEKLIGLFAHFFIGYPCAHYSRITVFVSASYMSIISFMVHSIKIFSINVSICNGVFAESCFRLVFMLC